MGHKDTEANVEDLARSAAVTARKDRTAGRNKDDAGGRSGAAGDVRAMTMPKGCAADKNEKQQRQTNRKFRGNKRQRRQWDVDAFVAAVV